LDIVEISQSAPVRICIFGATPPTTEWLADIASVPPSVTIELFGACAKTNSADTRIGHHGNLVSDDVHATLRSAAKAFPGDNLILLQAGSTLPAWWYERLVRALDVNEVLVASPLDNVDSARSPLPEGAQSDANAAVIDSLCFAYGRHQLFDWPTFSPLLSIWCGNALRAVDLEKIHNCTLPAQFASFRGVLLDHLYVANPKHALHGPKPIVAGANPRPQSALGELRENVDRGLADNTHRKNFYPGLDHKPVVLHILHGWGGGSERFVRDLVHGDSERHHLILVARGSFERRSYGEILELHGGTLSQPPLRRLHFSAPISSTSFGDRSYIAFLTETVRDFGIDAVMISSLIGHSLDALRTGLPTVLVGHDYFPLWPLLHRDFGDSSLAFDDVQRIADLKNARADFEFAQRDPDFWQKLRTDYIAAVIAARAIIAAPSRSMLTNLLRLAPEFSTLRQKIVPHGLEPWPTTPALTPPPTRARLRLLVPGRIRRGKGAELLRAALPALREHAELFLLGAGAEGMEFFGERDVHIVLNYRREDLPMLVAQIAPDAALLLPTVAETFSYTLSEMTSLGIPAIATRLGALGERIRDGVDGFLVAPEASAIAAVVAQLHGNATALATARTALSEIPQHTIVDMAADYRELLPLMDHAKPRYSISLPTLDSLEASSLADELGQTRRHASVLRNEITAQQHELGKRADWAIGLDKQIKHASSALRHLQSEFDERSAWAIKTDAQLQQVLGSLSWRITRPLRYAMRKFRALRTRLGFNSGRVQAAIHRTRGSLASRGFLGTIRRVADEFRRKPVPPSPFAVALPTEEFVPFSVPTSDTPRVSIVIPVFNKVAYTAACVRSLAQNADSVLFEIIVVDDCSIDATPQRLAQITGLRTIRNAQNLGFVGSCNAGAECAKGEFIVFLNNDTVVLAGWLEALLRCFDEEPDAGLVGAKLVYHDGRLQEAGGIIFSDGSGWNYGRFDDPADPRYNFRREVDYCSGAAILLRRELFDQLGRFDTRYAPAYYEDTDIAFAVRAAGKKVFYEPRAAVVHFEGITAGTDTTSGMKRFQVINREKFLEKWKNKLARHPAPIHEAALARAAANWRNKGSILIVDANTPMPDHDAGSLRMMNVMRLLREFGYSVSFLPDNRIHDGRYTEDLQALGVEVLYHPFVADPITWMRERGRDLDAIVLSRHYIAANYVGLARLYAPQARLIFDTVDLHYLREQRAAEVEGKPDLALQAERTKAQELKLMRECDISLVVSDAEKQLLAQELPHARIEILSTVNEIVGCQRPFSERRDLLFVGGFQHPPNVDAVLWFVREVFPQVRARLPDIVFHVIGSKAPPQILELAHDGVVIHGFVADITPFINGCRLSIAPLRYGAGIKGKINTAMSYGLPVVATSVAVEGMHLRSGQDAMVADMPADFAAAILRIYDDAALWTKLSSNGLENVRQHFSFDAARASLKRILPPLRPTN
jgi:GT2 family glycosyltransferase